MRWKKENNAVVVKNKKRNTWKQVKKYKYVYFMIIPAIIMTLIFRYYPLYGLTLAFKKYNPRLGIMKSPWIGLENFERLFADDSFFRSLKNTLIISLMKVFGGALPPIIIAILFKEIRSGKVMRVMQTIYTFPHFISWVVMGGILKSMFSGSGVINYLLGVFGLGSQSFLTNPAQFRWFILFTAIWKSVGWSAIYYLAAMSGIDTSLYEAATVDGANRWQRIIHITLPGIKEMIIINFILSFSGLMSAGFDQIFNLYNSTVYDVADVIDTYVYRITFMQAPSYGFSVALGMFTGIVNMILLLTANQISKFFGAGGIFKGGVREQ